jgi:hypothetical protein
MAGEESAVATVVQQQGNRVLLSFPMAGFPAGFKLHSGDRVVLVSEPAGLAVRPLVRSTTVTIPAGAVAKNGQLKIGKQKYVLQAASVRGQQMTAFSRDESGMMIIWTIESKSTKDPKRVIATRPLR